MNHFVQDLLFKISGLFALLANSSMGLFVYYQNKKNPLYIKFAAFSLSIAFWAVGSFFVNEIVEPTTALWVLRLCYAFGAFLPAFFVSFVFTIIAYESKSSKNFLKVLYGISTFFSIFAFTPYFIKGLRIIKGFDFRISQPSFLYYVFFCYFSFIVLFALLVLLREMRKGSKAQTNQLKYIFASYLIGLFAGIEYFCSVFGFLKRPPLDDYILIFTFSIMTYAIVRHQLMDIEVIIRRTAVFAGLFAFVYGVFTVVTVIGQEFFKSTLGWNQWLALVPTVFIITFTLRPLENFLTNVTERFLFQKKYDYRELLRTFTNEILTVLDLQKLMEQTIAGLIKIIKLESASVLLLDKDAKVYKMMAGTGVKNKNLIFKEDDTLISSLKATHQPIAQDKNSDKIEGRSSLKDDFKSLNARLCLPIILHDNLIGVLCLGMKKSGEDYNQDDMDVLLTLARAEAIAISNAQLFDELSKTQAEAAQREKMAVIGTLAAGINHEICNPLGIVRGQCEMFLLNLRDGFYKDLKQEEVLKISAEIMNKVIRETDRATGITKKLSSFARPSKRSDFEEVYIEKEVGEVLGLIGHDLQLSNVDVQTDFPKDFPVIVGDKKQIQEVFFNIIRNAAQAMDKKQGKIVVSGFSENGSAVVRIADNGTGIPQDKIEQVFNPFYTTKAPGKGTGLGLFIVKQVVERNKGTIAVESEVGVGTTFTLRFSTPLAALVA